MASAGMFSVFKGANVTLLFAPAVATNITGWTLEFSVRQTLAAAGTVFQLTTALTANGQLIVTDAASGNFSVNLTAAGTTQFIGGQTYDWDVWRIDAGFEDELAGGQFTVQGSARIGNAN